MENEGTGVVRFGIFHSLRYRNFRLFFFGQSISLVGTWMQQVAMSWLVYEITRSPLYLGVISFSSQIPAFLLSPLAGVYADKWNRHRILVVTQTLSMVQAFVLAALTFSGRIEVWHVLVLSLFIGCVHSLDIPSRQSFIIEMVERKENLSNAIALNSLMFNAARLVGPAIAGVIIAYTDEAVCFSLNGISFLAVIFSLLAMKVRSQEKTPGNSHIWEKLREGFVYAYGFFPIRQILIILVVMNLMGSSYSVLLPVYTKEVLGGDSGMYGFLVASAGMGALLATIFLARRKSVLGLGKMIVVASGIFGLGLAAFSLSRVFWLSSLLLAFSAFWLMTCLASCNIILQTIVDDDKRGRVMSLYAMAFMGTMSIGGLLVGALAGKFGVTDTMLVASICCIGGALVFAAKLPSFREAVRPIYGKMGMIPQMPPGPVA
jgi:MFS family permease